MGLNGFYKKKFKNINDIEKKLKKIYSSTDREYVRSLLKQGEDGQYYFDIQNPDKETEEKLNKIVKNMEKGTLGISFVKLILLGIIIGGIIFFNIFYKNKLVKQFVESTLEGIFEAKVDLYNPDLRILSGRLYFSGLTIADKDNPMTNLIDIGKSELDIMTSQILLGNFVFESLVCEEIKVGTQRKVSGELKNRKKKEENKKEEKKDSLKIPTKVAGIDINDLQKLDFNKILEEQKNNLKTVSHIENFSKTLISKKDIYQNKDKEIKSIFDNLQGKVERLSKTDVSKIQDINTLNNLINDINSLKNEIDPIRNKIENNIKEVSQDIKYVEENAKLTEKLIKEDKDYLISLIPVDFSKPDKIVTDYVDSFLKENFNKYYSYVKKALYYLNIIQQQSKKGEKPEKKKKVEKERFKGQTIYFPSKQYPKFLIQKISTSFYINKDRVAILIKNITNDMEKLGSPTTVGVDYKGNVVVMVDSLFDVRKSSKKNFELNTKVSNIFLSFDKNLEPIFVKDLKSNLDFETYFALGGSYGEGKLDILLKNINVTQSQDNFIAKTIIESINELKDIKFFGKYKVENENFDVALDSNINSYLEKKLKKFFDEQRKRLFDEANKIFNQYVSKYLDENNKYLKEFNGITKQILDSKNKIGEIEKILQSKRAEIDKQIEALKKKAEDELKKNIPKVDTPKVTPPINKLPGF